MENGEIERKSEWGNEETDIMLKNYAEYLHQVGPQKNFRWKKKLWEQISEDLQTHGYFKTPLQCENRYKTIKKRKCNVDYFSRQCGVAPASFHEKLEPEISIDDSIPPPGVDAGEVSEHSVSPPSTSSSQSSPCTCSCQLKRKKDIIETLLEIAAEKERNRERRHKEKMMLMKMFMQKLVGKSREETDSESDG